MCLRFFYVCVCFVCVYACVLLCASYPGSEDGVFSPGTRVTDGWESPFQCWELNPRLLEEQPVFISSDHLCSPMRPVSMFWTLSVNSVDWWYVPWYRYFLYHFSWLAPGTDENPYDSSLIIGKTQHSFLSVLCGTPGLILLPLSSFSRPFLHGLILRDIFSFIVVFDGWLVGLGFFF